MKAILQGQVKDNVTKDEIKEYVNSLVGNINEILDDINGEVV